jgi:hypothetical protein
MLLQPLAQVSAAGLHSLYSHCHRYPLHAPKAAQALVGSAIAVTLLRAITTWPTCAG